MNFSLTKKSVISLFVILLPILVTFLLGYKKNKEYLEDTLLNDLTVIAEAYEGQVYQFIEMSKRRAQDFSSDGFIRDELKKISGANASNSALTRHILKEKLPLDRHIKKISIASMDGKIAASTDPAEVGTDVSKKDFFTRGLQGISVNEVADGKAPLLSLSTIVSDRATGKPLGVLTNFMLLSELNAVLSGEFNRELGAISWKKGKRRTMEAFLVNRDGLLLTEPMFIQGGVLNKRIDTLPVSACLEKGREISGFYTDHRGVDVAGASMCMPSLGWTLVIEINASEALEPTSWMRNDALWTAIIVAGLILLTFAVFYRKVVIKLWNISAGAKEIAGGNYEIYIPPQTSDEIGALCDSFNQMAYDIKTRTLSLSESEQRLQAILDNSTASVYMKDVAGKYILVNRRFKELFALEGHDVQGKTDFDLFPEDFAKRSAEKDGAVIKAKGPLEFEETVSGPNSVRTYISSKFPIFDKNGRITAVCGISTDITDRKQAEESLRKSEERLNKAQEIAQMGSWDLDLKTNGLLWSEGVYRLFGLSPDVPATYESFIERVHPEDRERLTKAVSAAIKMEGPYSIDHRIILSDGTEKIVHEEGEVFYGEGGQALRMLGTVQDVTERKRIEFELSKLSMAIESSVNIIFITTRQGVIEYVNPMFEQVTGYTKDEVLGQTPRILSSGETPNQEYETLWNTITSGKTWRHVVKNKTKAGSFYWCNAVISPIKNENNEITHFLAVQEDITEKMRSEERIKYLAAYDEVTGLYNRSRYMELVDECLASGRCASVASLFIIDIDQFKFFNNTFGHSVGDEYLKRLAKLLEERLKEKASDIGLEQDPLMSRLSGDEFSIFLKGADEHKALAIAESVRAEIEAYTFTDVNASSTASIGIVMYPDHGIDAKDLFSKADAAMYRAKELGRNRVYVYRREDKEIEQMHSRLSWKEKILKALKEDRFEPWFQPLLDLRDGRIHHYEALARMRDEDGSILLPGAFIDIAERFGLIGLIDRRITEKSIELQAEMMKKGVHLSFGMNLSGKNLGDPELLTFIQSKLKELGADPKSIVFEITETAAISDMDKAVDFIKDLKNLGCHFALDDFGVGFTSFVYLKRMKVDYIKIDGSFIRKLHESPNDQIFVKSITDVAKGLRISSIAEFVEKEETLKLLKEYEIDFAQGYLIGKPAPVSSIRALASPEHADKGPAEVRQV